MAESLSFIEALRAQQREAAQEQTVELPVPGYRNPGLVARYRFLDPAEAKRIGARIRGSYSDDIDRLLYSTIDQMIAACVGLFARVGDELVPVDPDGSGEAARYDQRTADFFGFEVSEESPARDTVRAVFKGNDYAIIDHGALLSQWLSDTSREVTESLGER